MTDKMVTIICIVVLIIFIIISILLPKKAHYKGLVVFDIDNTVLCRGAMMGNSQCNRGSSNIGFFGPWLLYPQNPCSQNELIHPPTYDSQNNKWINPPQTAYSPDKLNEWGGNQPKYDGRCLKNELEDGRDISCSIHAPNKLALDPNNCDSSDVDKDGYAKGVDCGAKNRAAKIIKMCRDKNYAVAVNTAEFKDDAKSKTKYLKSIGFTDQELTFPEEGGNLTYNVSQGADLYSQAKQKGINLLALQKKYNLPKNKIILLDDQMANCKAVRDLGFKAYNINTTFGQTYGWSCDQLKDGAKQTDPGSCQCGITDKQIDEIFKLLEK
jgi:hypothetical protein